MTGELLAHSAGGQLAEPDAAVLATAPGQRTAVGSEGNPGKSLWALLGAEIEPADLFAGRQIHDRQKGAVLHAERDESAIGRNNGGATPTPKTAEALPGIG